MVGGAQQVLELRAPGVSAQAFGPRHREPRISTSGTLNLRLCSLGLRSSTIWPPPLASVQRCVAQAAGRHPADGRNPIDLPYVTHARAEQLPAEIPKRTSAGRRNAGGLFRSPMGYRLLPNETRLTGRLFRSAIGLALVHRLAPRRWAHRAALQAGRCMLARMESVAPPAFAASSGWRSSATLSGRSTVL